MICHPYQLVKPKLWENELYPRWIRSKPCCITGKSAHAAHVISKGARGSDWIRVPLCPYLHLMIQHQHGWARFEEETGISQEELIRIALEYLTEWLIEVANPAFADLKRYIQPHGEKAWLASDVDLILGRRYA